MHISVLVIGNNVEYQLNQFDIYNFTDQATYGTKEDIMAILKEEEPGLTDLDKAYKEYLTNNNLSEIVCLMTGKVDIMIHYNPYGKWDWFEIGGRYYNVLRATPDIPGVELFTAQRVLIDKTATAKEAENLRKLVRFFRNVVSAKLKYIDNIAQVLPVAIIYKGLWFEKNGWTGEETEPLEPELSDYLYESDNKQGYSRFKEKLFNILDPETQVTMVDCHV